MMKKLKENLNGKLEYYLEIVQWYNIRFDFGLKPNIYYRFINFKYNLLKNILQWFGMTQK